ncbi:MAG: ATPase domain-containing protein [Armatimonadota bacterium]
MSSYQNRSLEAPAATGIPGLDQILRGGFPRNHLYLVDGHPGTGKTTLGLRFLLEGVQQGEACLYITLSETRRELQGVAASHGISLDGLEVFELVASEETLQGDRQYTMFHAAEVELSETTREVLAEVERVKPARIVFDSLSEMRLLAQNSLRYRKQILALKQFFAGRDITVLFLDDRTADMTDRQVESIAHGVLTLEQIPLAYGSDRRRLRIRKLRGVDFHGGYHDFIIERGGLAVFPRLVAAEHSQEYTRELVKSGIPELDQLLGGGLNRGSSALLLGPSGVGKSSIATQYASAAADRGEHAVVFSFEEMIESFCDRSKAFGMNLERHLESGQLEVRQIDPAELCPGELVHAIREAVETRGATVVVLDSLNGYLTSMPEEQFLLAQLHELLTYLARQGVLTILVVAQHGLVGTMHSPVDTSYLADSVILLRFFEAEAAVHQAISVMKKRRGRHERTIRELTFENGIHVGPPLLNFHGVLTGIPQVLARRKPTPELDEL